MSHKNHAVVADDGARKSSAMISDTQQKLPSSSAPDTGGESIYGGRLPEMEAALEDVLGCIADVRKSLEQETGHDPVDHCLSRIKTEKSMREKCRRRHLPETTEAALYGIRDAIGVRLVCGFRSDIYKIRDRIAAYPGMEIEEEKDYIRRAKPNGYRSYHMILLVRGFYVEIQLRTFSMDTWAALEHQLRYKKNKTELDTLIADELKRCADELASTEISMQTIRDMILGSVE